MAIQSSFYSGTALESRTFPSTKHIATKQHLAVWRQLVSDSTWVQVSITEYQLINNACTLNGLLNQSIYKQIEVRVADEPNELTNSPTDIAVVAGVSPEIVIVADISTEVVTLAGVGTAITSLYMDKATLDSLYDDKETLDSINSDKSTLDSLYTDKAKLDSLYADKATLDSLFADKVKLDALYEGLPAGDSLYADRDKLDSLYADKITLDSIYDDKATLDSLFADKLKLDGLYASKTAMDSLYVDKATLDSLFADKVTLDRLYTSISNMDTVGTNIASVDTVSTNIASANTVATDLDKLIGTNQPTDSAILNALTNATNSANSATNAQLSEWEAEASRLTATSYAVEAENVLVNLVTSNGDGTYTYTPQTGVYSSLHYESKYTAFDPAIYQTRNEEGVANGYASLDNTGLVPASQLPSYVDDVIEVATYADLPLGTIGFIYIVVADETKGGDTSTYRWTGSVYALVSNTLTSLDVKNLYEGNTDTNVYTDAEKAQVAVTETSTQLDNRDTASRSTDNHTDGTTNGVYTLAERARLLAIEDSATADQTASEIETLYEGIADTNKYTDVNSATVSKVNNTAVTSITFNADGTMTVVIP